MADTVRVFGSIKALFDGKNQVFGSSFDPYTITLSADKYRHDQIAVPNETSTDIIVSLTGAIFFVIESPVAGVLTWVADVSGGAVSTNDNSACYLKPNAPFILPNKAHDYNATLATRLSSTVGTVTAIYFYQSSGSTVYVDVYAVA